MKKILALCLMLFLGLVSSAATSDDLTSTLSDLLAQLSSINHTLKQQLTWDELPTGDDTLRLVLYNISEFLQNDFFQYLPNADSEPILRNGLPHYFSGVRYDLKCLRDQGDITTNEIVNISELMSSNLVLMAELKADVGELLAIVPAVDTMSSELQAINRNLSTWFSQFQNVYFYLQDIYNLLYMDLSLIHQQLYSIYDKIGDVTFDMTNALNVIWKGGIGVNGTVQVSLVGSDGQPFELPEYIYDWYTSDTYIQGNEYTGYFQPLMSLSGNFYGRQFEWWNKNYSQNPLNFFLSRWTDNTSNVSYQGVDGWYNALIRLVDNNGQILEANNSLLAFIAAKLSETNTVSTNEMSAAVVDASSSGSGFQASFNLETPDLDNPLPNWSASSLPDNVYFGTVNICGSEIVFNVPTSEFAVFFTLIRTGFQLTYWGLVLAFFWFAFRVLRWVCPYLAAVVHWLLQFN